MRIMINDERFELECKERLRTLTCSIHHKQGITISQAQSILEDYADADMILNYMLNEKDLMITDGNKYEYTFEGLKRFYGDRYSEAQTHYGKEKLTEEELMKYVIEESARTCPL